MTKAKAPQLQHGLMERLQAIYGTRRELLDQLYEKGRVNAGAHEDLLKQAMQSLAVLHGIGRLPQERAQLVAQQEVQRFTQCIFEFDKVLKVIRAFELAVAH